MADTKITALTALTTTDNSDVLAIVDDPAGTPVTSKITVNNLFKLPAGTTSLAPLRFTSGTNLTTAEAGAMEYDGKVHYSTQVASSRAVNTAEQVIVTQTAYTLPTAGLGLRALFGSPTNGTITLGGNTTYFFECAGSITSLSATSGSMSLGFAGTASTTKLRYIGVASKAAATAATVQAANVGTSASTIITAANTTTTAQFNVSGYVTVDTGGTFIPSIAHSVEARPIIGVGSFFKIYPIGTETVESVGNWS